MTFDWVKTIIWIVVPLVAAVLVNKLIGKVFKKHNEIHGEQIPTHIFHKIVTVTIWAMAIVIACQQFEGFQKALNTLLASSGVVALGISLAAQESLQNIIDGVILQIFKPFDIGDRITLPEKGLTGNITEMNLRHTVITTYNNTKYILSNKSISQAIIENSSQNDDVAYPIDVQITYDSDLDKAIKLLQNIVGESEYFIDKRTEDEKKSNKEKVTVLVTEFAASGINLRATMVSKDIGTSFKACQEARKALKKEFDANGIQFPFNTITIQNLNELNTK